MKILHAADLHQGILTHSRPDPATGIPSRILDVAEAWSRVVDVAIAEEVDVLVLAGDVFHTASPDATTLALFAQHLRRLGAQGIHATIIPGNHDRAPHSGRRTVLEAFHDPEWCYVGTVPTVVEVAGVAVAMLPSSSRAELAAAVGQTRLETEESVVEVLRFALGGLAANKADVLTLHTSIAGGILGSEKDLAIIPEPMLRPIDLEGPWQVVAAGHIHRAQHLPREDPHSPAIVYAGSVAPLTFGEEGEHGVWIHELSGDRPESGGRFVEIESRPLFSLEWNADLLRDPDVAGVDVGSFERLEGAIVRVTGVPLDAIEDTRGSLEVEGAWIVKVEPERAEERPADVLAGDELPSTREALEAWLPPRVPDDEERRRILELAGDL